MLIKSASGKLTLPLPAADFIHKHLDKNRIALLPLRMPHFAELEKLPPIHRDPFDHMLVAQAVRLRAVVVSRDPFFGRYGVETVPA